MDRRHLTKAQAKKLFLQIDRSPRGDVVWRRTAWAHFTEALCKEGRISERQAATWLSPF